MEKKHCFGALYKFELLKILKNKVAIITFLVLFGYAFVQGEFEVRGNISSQELSKYEEINGRTIDEGLLDELKAVSDDAGNVIDENRKGYRGLAYWIQDVIGYRAPIKNLDIETIYSKRETNIQEGYEAMCLTPEEIAFWNDKENELIMPFSYHDAIRSSGILEGTTNYMIMMSIIIAASLSSIFASETHRRTDPMVRASINGKKELYFAKILAGMSYAFGCVAVLLITFYVYIACRWGITGMECMVQVYLPLAQTNMTIGGLLAILVTLLIFGTLLISSVALLISNVTRNAVATMTTVIGLYIGLFMAGMHVPLKARFLSQLLYLLPGMQVTSRVLYDYRLINLGRYFMSYQVAPVLYVLLSIVFIVAGYVYYAKYEIKNN